MGTPGALQFSSATYSGNENQGTATITVTRTGFAPQTYALGRSINATPITATTL